MTIFPRLTPRKGYADGPFGQVHYQFLGEGVPLVLLHQAPMTSGQFDAVYEPLARRGIMAIGIDMPGFGLSDPTPDVPSVTDYGRVVPAVLDALNIDRAAILGHHTGALAATEATLLAPDRFSALILNGPLPITEAERADFMAGLHLEEKAFTALPDAAHMVGMFRIRACPTMWCRRCSAVEPIGGGITPLSNMTMPPPCPGSRTPA